MARGHGVDARCRRQPGQSRHLCLGAGAAGARRVQLRLAGRDPRPVARARHRRRPGYRHLLAAAVAHHAAPRDPARHRDRRGPFPWRPPAVPPHVTGLSHLRPAARTGDGSALRRPPGARSVARLERARLPQRPRLLRRRGRGLPHLADRAVRRPRGTERGLGHGVLVAALLVVGADPAATAGCGLPQPHPAAGLRPLLVMGAAGLPAGRDRDPARDHAGHPDHDQLHGHGQPGQRHELCRVGKRCRHRLQRPLPDGGPTGRVRGAVLLREPDEWHRRARSLVADGALGGCRAVAAGQPAQGFVVSCGGTA